MPLTAVPVSDTHSPPCFSKRKQGSLILVYPDNSTLPLTSVKDGLRGGEFSDRALHLPILLLAALLSRLGGRTGQGVHSAGLLLEIQLGSGESDRPATFHSSLFL